MLDDLLLVIERKGSIRETVRPDDAAGSICPRLAVLRYCDGADLDEFSTLETAEDDGIAIKSQIAGGVIKRVTRCRMRLAIINVQQHARRGVTLRVDRLVRVLDILPILLEGGGLASGGRARGELRFC